MAQSYIIASNFGNLWQRGDFQYGLAIPAFSSLPSLATMAGGNIRSGLCYIRTSDNTLQYYSNGIWYSASGGGGSGTVTSVGLSVPGVIFSVSGSPVTTSGTLALSLLTQTANRIFAGPTTGSATTPTFRALVSADLPAGTGTVTSVGLSSNATWLTIGSTPITTSGTITANLTTGLVANQILATPNGSTGTVTLRSLVNADFPTSGVTAGSYTVSSITVNAQGIITSASSGTAPVVSVSGTASRITVTGTTSVTIDISGAYIGQTSITTLGIVTAGTWNATKIDELRGGTNQASYLTGDILYASAANTLSKLAIGSSGQVLTISAGIPSWATPTTGTVTSISGTANRITSTGGATPVIDIAATYIGQTSLTTLGTIITGTWQSTIIGLTYGGTGANLSATGGTSQVLRQSTVGGVVTVSQLAASDLSNGTTGSGSVVLATSPTLVTPALGTPSSGILSACTGLPIVAGTSGTLTETRGGTNQTTYTTGDTLYASASNILSKLAIGSTGQVLTVTAGIPSWATPTTGTVTSVSGTSNRITSTGGATPVIDISASYVGQSSITTLGTIVTGVWNGTVITPVYGGTGVANNASSTWTISGNFGTTVTVTGTTTVTLPTTGTLYGTASGSITSAQLATSLTDETGSGVVVFGTDPSLTISSPGTTTFGYLGMPQNSQSAAYTTVMTDAGKHLYHPGADTTARIWTIAANSSVAYPIGTTLTFINDTSGGVITIAITSDTLVLAGSGSTGSRTLAANGVATAVKMTSVRWIINGTGLT